MTEQNIRTLAQIAHNALGIIQAYERCPTAASYLRTYRAISDPADIINCQSPQEIVVLCDLALKGLSANHGGTP